MDSNTTLIAVVSVAVILIGVYMMCKCDGNKSERFVGQPINLPSWFGCPGCCTGIQLCQGTCNKNDKNCLNNCNNVFNQCLDNNSCQPVPGNGGWTYCP